MKHAKRLLSFLLAVLMVFSMSATAFAEDEQKTYTISVAADDNHTYEIYQIFTGDVAEELDANGYPFKILSNVKWGQNGKGNFSESVDENILKVLAEYTNETDDSKKLSIITQYLDSEKGTFKDADGNNIILDKKTPSIQVPGGYYLIKDVDKPLQAGEVATQYIVQVVGDVSIERKVSGVPEVEKKVLDVNDSTGEKSKWQDSADYDIGDSIPYQLTGTIPEGIERYSHYYYEFRDELSKGLTYDEGSAEVWLYNADGTTQEVTGMFEIQTAPESKSYGSDSTTLTIKCQDILELGYQIDVNSKIVVEYSATLNKEAVIGADGNPNDVTLIYSNDPNWDGNGENVPTDETKPDTVVVFTYEIVVNKFDPDGESLAGAMFTLQKKNADGFYEDYVQNEKNVEFIINENGKIEAKNPIGNSVQMVAGSQFTIRGLDDGEYRLIESETPKGYNTIKPIDFTVTAEHNKLSDYPQLISLTVKDSAGTVTDKLNDDGTSEKSEDGIPQFDVSRADGELLIGVINNKGTNLPTTGGMGTTLFYVVGGLLVLGAGVMLVVRKRMGAE